MNYTIEYNQGFYHALKIKATKVQDCPYFDNVRSTGWIEGYLEGIQAVKESKEKHNA